MLVFVQEVVHIWVAPLHQRRMLAHSHRQASCINTRVGVDRAGVVVQTFLQDEVLGPHTEHDQLFLVGPLGRAGHRCNRVVAVSRSDVKWL